MNGTEKVDLKSFMNPLVVLMMRPFYTQSSLLDHTFFMALFLWA